MQANVDKIIAAAVATNSFNETGEVPPDEIERYPAFYQYGREISADGLQGGRKVFAVDIDYTCYIIVDPESTFSALDTLRSSFLSKLADQNAIVVSFSSRQFKFMIGSEEAFVDLLVVTMRNELTMS